jgi:hypothetical protein
VQKLLYVGMVKYCPYFAQFWVGKKTFFVANLLPKISHSIEEMSIRADVAFCIALILFFGGKMHKIMTSNPR